MPVLRYAQRDAAEITRLFWEAQFEQVYYFSDKSPPITDSSEPFDTFPRAGTLQYFLEERFKQVKLFPEDNLWFFFSGHGIRSGRDEYLMPADAAEGTIETTGLGIHKLSEQLKLSGAGNIILLLDACRNQNQSPNQKGTSGIGHQSTQGVITIWSTTPYKPSFEIPEIKHGAFTYALLEALQSSNCATADRLDQYLSYRVPEINQTYKTKEQYPTTRVEPLSKKQYILLPQRAESADVEPLKKEAYKAEANGDYAQARQMWQRVLAVWNDPETFGRIEYLVEKRIRGEGSTALIQKFEQDLWLVCGQTLD